MTPKFGLITPSCCSQSLLEQSDMDAVKRQTVDYKLKERKEMMGIFFKAAAGRAVSDRQALDFMGVCLRKSEAKHMDSKCCTCVDSM